MNGDITNFEEQPEHIQELLQSLEKLPNTTNNKCILLYEEFITGIRKVFEGKSLSGSGRHYSLYKAIVAFPFTTSIIVQLINKSITNQIILQRWKKNNNNDL